MGEPVALNDTGEPFGWYFAAAFRVSLGSDEGEADLHDPQIDIAAEADARENEHGLELVKFMGDDQMLIDVEHVAGEEAYASGGEVAGVDMNPGLAELCREVDPHGMAEIDAWTEAAVSAFGGLLGFLGIEAGDKLLEIIDFLTGESEVMHGDLWAMTVA